MRNGRLTVIAPFENSPAARAGILAGDTILAIDGVDVERASAFDLDEHLAGQPGTPVKLRMLHAEQSKPEDVTIVRGPVSIQTIRGFRRDPTGGWDHLIDAPRRIGYIRVASFHHNTMHDFDAALDALIRGGVDGLILDLRFNPGGLMEVAVEIVDRFLTEGVIATTVTRREAVSEHSATPHAVRGDLRVAVLVNGGSASSSEIVAGALQAHDRATVVGERTFGKGSVQQLIDLESHHAAIKLTVAYYRLPNGRVIHRTRANEHTDSWGVIPDVVIVLSREEQLEIQDARRALDVAFAGSHGTTSESTTPRTPAAEIVRDRQLAAAIAALTEESQRWSDEQPSVASYGVESPSGTGIRTLQVNGVCSRKLTRECQSAVVNPPRTTATDRRVGR